jgi:hypothetical protein
MLTVTLRFHELVIDGKAVLVPADAPTTAALGSLLPGAPVVFPVKRKRGRPPLAKTAQPAKRGPGRPPKKK